MLKFPRVVKNLRLALTTYYTFYETLNSEVNQRLIFNLKLVRIIIVYYGNKLGTILLTITVFLPVPLLSILFSLFWDLCI